MADELASILARRTKINDGEQVPPATQRTIFNPYTEFPVRSVIWLWLLSTEERKLLASEVA